MANLFILGIGLPYLYFCMAGIGYEFGIRWAVAAIILGALKVPAVLSIGAYLYALNYWNAGVLLSALFALPALIFQISILTNDSYDQIYGLFGLR